MNVDFDDGTSAHLARFRLSKQILFLALVTMAALTSSAGLANDEQLCEKADKSAIESCTRLIEKAPSPVFRAIYLKSRGRAYEGEKRCDEAISDFEEAFRLWPSKSGNDNFYANLHMSIGNTLSTCRGDQAKAIKIYTDLIRLRPDNIGGYYGRAGAKHESGDLDGALIDLDLAFKGLTERKFRKEMVDIHNLRGLVWRDKRNFGRAISYYDQALRLSPNDWQALANRGEAWRLAGDLERALQDQNRAVAIAAQSNKPDGTALILRGDTRRYRGNTDLAIADYQAALRVDPDDASALTGLGLTHERNGAYAEARSMYAKVINLPKADQLIDMYKSALSTARARLAALDSGETQPTIPPVPLKAKSSTSIPTPPISASKSLTPERIQATAKEGRRIALVIGNSSYKHVQALSNPKNDAEAVAKTLRNIGFATVTLVSDANREALIDALRTFASEADNSDWAMVYYAGHGIEVGGINYLIPIDAKLAVDRDIEFEAVSVNQVLRVTSAAKKIKLIMLDACRDNPFSPKKTAAPDILADSSPTAGGRIASRSTNGRGLAEVKVQGATLVVFAAKDGQVALDGEGENSPFAVAVVQRIATPGVEINKVFRLVRDDVMEATAGRQEPYTYGSLPGKEDFFFVVR